MCACASVLLAVRLYLELCVVCSFVRACVCGRSVAPSFVYLVVSVVGVVFACV